MAAKKRARKKEDISCRVCKHATRHTVVANHHTLYRSDDGDMWGRLEHDLLSCDGCSAVTYRVTANSSEDPEPSISYYPPRGGRFNREPKDFDNLPYGSAVESVYRQTITAFNQQLMTLVAAGVRLLIEGVCNERGIKNGEVTNENGKTSRERNLEGKINGMVEHGLIGKNQAPILHQIRFLGNDAAHELDLPTGRVLEAAIDIVEHILQQVYELPERAKALVSRKRKK